MGRFKRLAVLLFITCLVVVSWGIFKPEPVQQVFAQSDKAAHFAAFFCLALTGRLAMMGVNAYCYWFAMLLVSFLMEYAQGLVQVARISSIYDAIANGIGVLLAFIFIHIMTRYRSSISD